MKKVILTFGVTLALLFTGCGDADLGSAEDGAKRLEIQQLTDKGEFDTIIQLLENDASYQNAYPGQEYKAQLASAYLTKAGFTIDKIIELQFSDNSDSDSDENEDTIASFSSLADGFDYNYLDKAVTLFLDATDLNCSDNKDRSAVETDICLFSSIAGIAVGINSFQDALGIDLDVLLEASDSNATPPILLEKACAYEYALSNPLEDASEQNLTSYTCNNDAVINIDGDVEFTFGGHVEHITITVDGNFTQSELIDYNPLFRSIIETDGNCSSDYTVQTDPINFSAGIYRCPINQDAASIASAPDALESINALVENAENIQNILPEDVLPVDENGSTDVDAFVEEIAGPDGVVDEADLLNYFNNQADSEDNTSIEYCIFIDGSGEQSLGEVDNNGTCQAQ